MCPYLPDLFVCVPKYLANLNSCNWIKLPKTFSTKTRTTTWVGKDLSRTRKIWTRRRKREGQGRWWKRWGKANCTLSVLIFGCISFPSQWRTFDSCVNQLELQQLVQLSTWHRCICRDISKKWKNCQFLERLRFTACRALKGCWRATSISKVVVRWYLKENWHFSSFSNLIRTTKYICFFSLHSSMVGSPIQILLVVWNAKVWIFLNIQTAADSSRAQFLFEAEVTALNYFPEEASVEHN